MKSPRTLRGTVGSVAVFPFRIVYRAVLYVVTVFFLGFAYALGGVPRIEKPEKKNPITDSDRR